jgi:phosphoglycolate phosphatase-like HAD superfamily hydrolase
MQAEGLVDEVVGGAESGGVKPQALATLAEMWGLPTDQMAYVGDAAGDMAAARSVGVIPIGAAWFSTSDPAEEMHQAGAQMVFDSPSAVITWLQSAVS